MQAPPYQGSTFLLIGFAPSARGRMLVCWSNLHVVRRDPSYLHEMFIFASTLFI